MKERPILFSAPMVRTLLDGSKTQTRRVCKNKVYSNGFHFDGHDILCHNDYLPPSAMLMDVKRGKDFYTTSNLEGWEAECPYGQPGDQLWVRETWGFNPDFPGMLGHACYRADPGMENDGIKWKPSIHMPRAACRIKLEITGIRVERLQDISEADARAEGVLPPGMQVIMGTLRSGYRTLWESLNGENSWEANPWVWVIEFRRLTA